MSIMKKTLSHVATLAAIPWCIATGNTFTNEQNEKEEKKEEEREVKTMEKFNNLSTDEKLISLMKKIESVDSDVKLIKDTLFSHRWGFKDNLGQKIDEIHTKLAAIDRIENMVEDLQR